MTGESGREWTGAELAVVVGDYVAQLEKTLAGKPVDRGAHDRTVRFVTGKSDMPITWKENTLTMRWCLDCHRNPEKYLRPREQVFNLHWKPEEDQIELGQRLKKEYHVLGQFQMTNCSTCHR